MANDYGNLIGRSCPGFLLDSSDYNIDGTCYVSPNQLNLHAGRIVHVDKLHDGIYKEMSAMFHPDGNDAAYGVVFRDGMSSYRTENGHPIYNPLEPISVVTHGRVWVVSDSIMEAPVPHSPVHTTLHGLATGSGALEISGWTYTGDFCRISGGYSIVGVQVKQSHGHLENEFKIKVNGIHLTPSHQNPIKVNTPVIIFAEVSPDDATNKVGTWSLDDNVAGTLEVIDDRSVKFTPTHNMIDDVFVNWSATDGSDVRGMVKLTYVP